MRTVKTITFSLALILCVLALPIHGQAQQAGNKYFITFSQPVGIPGMVLPAGEYVFKTTGPDGRVLQIWDNKESKIYASLFTTKQYRPAATSKTVAIFGERTIGSPVELKALFPANELTGEELVY